MAVAGGTVTTLSAGTASSSMLVVNSTLGLSPGMTVSGTNVPSGAVITSIIGNTLWLSSTASNAVAAGTLLTFGSLSNFTGSLSISAGTMRLQATSATSDVLSNSSSVIFTTDAASSGFGKQNAGGRLEYLAFGGSSTEVAGSLTATAGAASVALTNGGTLIFASLGARSSGTTVDFQPGAGRIGFTSVSPVNGILGGWATFNGVDFAGTLSGGTVAAATYASFVASGGSATTNYLLNGGTTTSGSVSANAVKLTGSGTVALGGQLNLTSGGLLFDNSNGAMTITGSFIPATSESIVVINGSASTNALTIASLLSAPLTKSGNGILILSGANTYMGNTTVNAGTLRLAGSNARLGNQTASFFTNIRQNAVLDLNGAGSSGTLYIGGPSVPTTLAGMLQGAGVVDNSSGTAMAISIAPSTSTSTSVFSGVLSNSGSGSLSLVRNGASGTQYLTGLNTYTGATVLSGSAILAVHSLANGGSASSIGASSNAASNLVFNGGTLKYTGSDANFVQFTQTPSVAIDRLFTLAGNGAIDSSGNYGNNNLTTGVQNNATLVFANTGTVAFAGTGARTLTLTGNSTGDNEIALKLVDNGTSALSVNKTSTGQWLLTGQNTYSGATIVSAGVLQAQDGVGLPTTSNLTLNGGVFQSDGTFSRTLGTGAGQVQFGASGGGFAASATHLNVNLGGVLTMGTGAFAGSTLILNAANAPGDVDFQSNINLGTGARTIQVDDNVNTGMDFATISGVLSGGSGGITSLTKTGAGN